MNELKAHCASPMPGKVSSRSFPHWSSSSARPQIGASILIFAALSAFGNAGEVYSQSPVHVGTCPARVGTPVCQAAPTCKPNAVYGGIWVPGKPFPKGTSCTTADLPASADATCNGDGLCLAPNGLSGVVNPRYEVLFVLYAPPGSAVSKGVSKADYGSESTTGSTVGETKSFKSDTKITASVSASFVATASLSVSYDQSTDNSDKTALEIKKTVDTDVADTGPGTDGIDHNQDEIWLWTNPEINIVSVGSNITTSLTAKNGVVARGFLTVGQLKQYVASADCPAGDNVCATYRSDGFTNTDFQNILNADPFWNGPVPLDPNRFIETSLTFPFQPGNQTETYELVNESTQTTTLDSTYVQALNLTASVGYKTGVADASLQVSDTWTWTHEYSQANSMGTTQKATATIGAPSASWAGPLNIGVYYDCVWQTFYFQYLDLQGNPELLSGTAYNSLGKTLVNARVTLTFPGRILRTYTDAKGHYSFHAVAPRSIGVVSVGATRKSIKLSSQKQSLDLRMEMEKVPVKGKTSL